MTLQRSSLHAVAAAVAVMLGAPSPASARPAPPTAEELSTARDLFKQAIDLERAGKYEQAITIFRQVAKVADSPTLHYHIGLCAEKLGRLTEALNEYEVAVKRGRESNANEVVENAGPRAEELRKRVPRLVVKVPDDAAGVTITIDDKPVNAALAGAPIMVNPGAHTVTVKAESHTKPFKASVKVAEAAVETVQVDLGPRVDPTKGTPPASQPPVPDKAAQGPAPSMVPFAIAAAVAGACTAAAVVTGIVANGKADEFDAANANPAEGSFAERESLRSSALTMEWVSTGLTIGAVAAGGVAVYLLLRKPDKPQAAGLVVTPWGQSTGGGLAAAGRF